jgi:hypothetical protein
MTSTPLLGPPVLSLRDQISYAGSSPASCQKHPLDWYVEDEEANKYWLPSNTGCVASTELAVPSIMSM